MLLRKKLILSLIAPLSALLLCISPQTLAQSKNLVVGVTPGPHAQVMNKVKELAAPKGLNIKLIEFNNYALLNQALSNKDIDANSFQHRPYLDNQVSKQNLNAVWVADTLIFPMGLYSKKVKSVEEIKKGATIAIPNDPSNGGRALILLETAKLIKLKPDVGVMPTVRDITDNPLQLKIMELDAALLPRTLGEVDASIINTNFAISAGLNPQKDAILAEKKDSLYVNIIAAHKDNANSPEIQQLIKIYQSDAVKKFVDELFEGSAIVAW